MVRRVSVGVLFYARFWRMEGGAVNEDFAEHLDLVFGSHHVVGSPEWDGFFPDDA